VTNGAKPDRADVCIIGAGASGAAAAKVLTERGMRVVMLERGPWRTRETFGGDELANINRYNLWPDPLLNPRTVRTSADEEARMTRFLAMQLATSHSYDLGPATRDLGYVERVSMSEATRITVESLRAINSV
jgi:flavin-dependent dehydrogenase